MCDFDSCKYWLLAMAKAQSLLKTRHRRLRAPAHGWRRTRAGSLCGQLRGSFVEDAPLNR